MDTSRRRETGDTSGKTQPRVGVAESQNPPADDDMVARRAYQRFEERGREDGHDVDDWLEAERELGRNRQSRDQNSD